ncbi:putative E3 SUMO-protein ligase [Triangularia verruculosa]|uniref:E3 SUMO-protein ligase n=1 Tax=Triangularia verruculosa TaxID=2587418 RepID=A0AAN7ASZ1_9PEZI|nr:putative E3 SUMO-protein ligase [Triangularia verruculosa]
MADRTAELQNLTRTVQNPAIQKTVLQQICQVNGLSKTGNKVDLQRRINQQLVNVSASRDWQQFEELRKNILARATLSASRAAVVTPIANPQDITVRQAAVGHPLAPTTHYQPRPATPPQYATMVSGYGSSSYPGGYGGYNAHPGGLLPHKPPVPRPAEIFAFKSTPFYELRHQLGKPREMDIMATHRNTEKIEVRASDLQMCLSDPSIKVLVFCATGTTPVQDIAFPYQCELKVNGDEVKANLRGLKNKPGSTKPVDVTSMLRLRPPNYLNRIEVTYALTQKKFWLSAIICKTTTVEGLVTQIRQKIRKEHVIEEINQKASDPDVIATSQNLSLKCPITYMRLTNPCRGVKCNHIQCFDASSYLQMQEQSPLWLCPICNKATPFDQLAIDEYARDILARTSDSTEQVTIEPNGEWDLPGVKKETTGSKSQEASFIDDDDLVVYENPSKPSYSSAQPASSAAYLGTPQSGASRDTSAAPRSTSKRAAPEVIDLISSDEEDAQPAKRSRYY